MKMRAALPALDPCQRYEINEACDYLRQSRAKLYQDIKGNLLRVIKDGSRTYIPGTEIIRRSSIAA